MKLVSLNEEVQTQNGKYDLIYKGRTLFFRVSPHGDGVEVSYVERIKFGDTLPDFLKGMVGNGDEITERTVAGTCFHLKWWEKLIGITLKRKVLAWVNAKRKEVNKVHQGIEQAHKLKQNLGL